MARSDIPGEFRYSRGARVLIAGFTLVELMIVVVILGILAAVALPAYTRYVRRSRTSEALLMTHSIYHLEIAYYQNTQELSSATSFATCEPEPTTAPSSAKYAPNTSVWVGSANWSAIGFVVEAGHYYQYSADGSNTGMTSRAVGNLDGDATFATFERRAVLNSGEVQAQPIAILNELE